MLPTNTHTTGPHPEAPHQTPNGPPPTQWEKDIEAARRRTVELYHSPSPDPSLSTWYIRGLPHTSIRSRMNDLYIDYSTTLSRHATFTNLSLHFKTNEVLGQVYARVVCLYRERLSHIHACGMKIAALLACWLNECAMPDEYRNEEFVAACESTLGFLEQDYICRTLDFVTEIYALLESCDEQSAEMVTADLEEAWPWTKGDFVIRLTNLVVRYEGVEVANHDFVREGGGGFDALPTPFDGRSAR